MMKHATKVAFLRLCEDLTIDDVSARESWRDLVRCYTEPHRHYHNLEHIDFMLSQLASVEGANDAMAMAIWFHDAVYDPRSARNEAASAEFFNEMFGRRLPEAFRLDVERLILATDPQRERGTALDERLITDIDLLILASEPEDYRSYVDAVRKEYAFVPDDAFRTGRLAVMTRFLESPIYRSELFHSLESRARANISEEIQRLRD